MRRALVFIILASAIAVFFTFRYNTSLKTVISRAAIVLEPGNRDRTLRYRLYLFGVLPIGTADLSYTAKGTDARGKSSTVSLAVRTDGWTTFFCPLAGDWTATVNAGDGYPIDSEERSDTVPAHSLVSAIFAVMTRDFERADDLELPVRHGEERFMVRVEGQSRFEMVNGQSREIIMTQARIMSKDRPDLQCRITRIVALLIKGDRSLPVMARVFFKGGIFVIARLIEVA